MCQVGRGLDTGGFFVTFKFDINVVFKIEYFRDWIGMLLNTLCECKFDPCLGQLLVLEPQVRLLHLMV